MTMSVGKNKQYSEQHDSKWNNGAFETEQMWITLLQLFFIRAALRFLWQALVCLWPRIIQLDADIHTQDIHTLLSVEVYTIPIK